MSEAFYTLTVSHFLVLAAILFAIGVAGVLLRRNALVLLMSVELMLNAGNLTLLAFARYHGGVDMHSFAFVVIAIAAAEAAVGLALVVAVFRSKHTANIDELTELKN